MSLANIRSEHEVVSPTIRAFEAYSDKIATDANYSREDVEKEVLSLKEDVQRELDLFNDEMQRAPHDKAEELLKNLPKKIDFLWCQFQVRLLDHQVKHFILECQDLAKRIKQDPALATEEIEALARAILNRLEGMKEIDPEIEEQHFFHLAHIKESFATAMQDLTLEGKEVFKEISKHVEKIDSKCSQMLNLYYFEKINRLLKTSFKSSMDQFDHLKEDQFDDSFIDQMDHLVLQFDKYKECWRAENPVETLQQGVRGLQFVRFQLQYEITITELEFSIIYRTAKMLKKMVGRGPVDKEKTRGILAELNRENERLKKEAVDKLSPSKKRRLESAKNDLNNLLNYSNRFI